VANIRKVTNSFERALMLLDLLEKTPGGLKTIEIAKRLAIPKSSCFYITSKLVERGYIQRDDETACYKIGLTPLALAHASLREIGFRSLAEPILYKLALQSGASAAIGMIERGRVLIVDRVEGPEFVQDALQIAEGNRVRLQRRRGDSRIRQDRDIGRELAIHSTALGKVLLAFKPEQQANDLISALQLTKFTSHTITSKAELKNQLSEIRDQGYAIADSEQDLGIRAIAAPLFFRDNNAVHAAVTINGHIPDDVWVDREALVAAVINGARQISKRIWQLSFS
jgi:DNA-binding IclR family transcriptional regulator